MASSRVWSSERVMMVSPKRGDGVGFAGVPAERGIVQRKKPKIIFLKFVSIMKYTHHRATESTEKKSLILQE